MPKIIPEDELRHIEFKIEEFPDGASMKQLAGEQASEAEREAVRRRLAKLIEQGRVKKIGSRKATKYHLTEAALPEVLLHKEDADLKAEGGLFIPDSMAGEVARESIRRPVKNREIVGYVRGFLSDYKPNRTFFLSENERKYLADIGNSSQGVQPAGTYLKQILDRVLIDLTFNSSRLEKNDYSVLDTKILIEHGKVAEGRTAQETQMILNHKEAIEFLANNPEEIGFNRHTILNLHALLSNNLLEDPEASGRLRHKSIEIGSSTYQPLDNPQVIEECFAEILTTANRISDPFEQSIFTLIHIPYLQPFDDVNKRVSRLSANIPFIKDNLSPLSFIEVDEKLYVDAMLSVYELNKTELMRDMFIWAYERSAKKYAAMRQLVGEPDPFRLKYRQEIKDLISSIVVTKIDRNKISHVIKDFVQFKIPVNDIEQFRKVVEIELLGLHEGNFARYQIRATEFFEWKVIWES